MNNPIKYFIKQGKVRMKVSSMIALSIYHVMRKTRTIKKKRIIGSLYHSIRWTAQVNGVEFTLTQRSLR